MARGQETVEVTHRVVVALIVVTGFVVCPPPAHLQRGCGGAGSTARRGSGRGRQVRGRGRARRGGGGAVRRECGVGARATKEPGYGKCDTVGGEYTRRAV